MNIQLKKIEEKDLESLRQWRMKDNVTRYMLTDPVISKEDQVDWFNRIRIDNSREDYVIWADDIKIGYFGITNIDEIEGSCEIGFYIGDDNYRGKGLFRTIEQIAENIIINDLKLHTINITVLSDNPIRSLYYKMGFMEKKINRTNYKKNGNDYILVSLFKKV